TPDGLPIIGRAPALDNLTLATGHGMWGLQLAPLTARLAASIALGTAPECDVAPLRADRFSAPWRAGGRNHDAHAVEV
ncbi:MAG TPA: FAD-dependent oxidoreductase, partial [Solirubrobacter sp.]|nr:FAD-dependent oxidoreductase [Solirubrobacter sp.]